MKKLLRWQGLAVFIVFTIVFCGFWLFFVDGFIEEKIEEIGTDAVGAKVELDGADLSLFPLGLTLTGLQVTDPDKPMTNAVEVARIVCSIETRNLFWSKVIIKEMSLDRVRLNTLRKTSGAITESASTVSVDSQKEKSEESQLVATVKIPDIQEILEKEPLESQKVIELIKADIKAKKESWKKKIAELPNKEKVEEYKQKLEKFKSMQKGGFANIFEGIMEGTTVLENIQRDWNLVKTAGMDLEKDLTLLRKREDEAKKALKNDIRRLKEKYSLSGGGIANMSKLLFGEEIGKYTKLAVRWYERIKPFLEGGKEQKEEAKTVKPVGGKGVDVRFKEDEPLPDFLIRLAKITNIETQNGILSGRIKNITTAQDVLGVPLTFLFSGDKIDNLESLKFNGVFNHIIPSESKDSVDFLVKKYQARDVTLSDNVKLATTLREGLVDLDVKTRLSGERLAATITVDITSTKLSVEGPGKSNELINSALSGISRLTLSAEITGTLREQNVKLKSSLDDIVKNIGAKMVKNEAAKFEKELDAAITQKVSGQLSGLNSDIGGLKLLDGDLSSRLELLGGLL